MALLLQRMPGLAARHEGGRSACVRPSKLSGRLSLARPQHLRCQAAADKPADRPSFLSAISERWDPRQLFNAFSDPACNRKLLALCIGQVRTSQQQRLQPTHCATELQVRAGERTAVACSRSTSLCTLDSTVLWVPCRHYARWPRSCTTHTSQSMCKTSWACPTPRY